MLSSDLLVLVIGQSQGCAEQYERLLQRDHTTSYQVFEAVCRDEALANYQSYPLDGILLDVPFVQADCRSLLAQVRSHLGEPTPPVVIIGQADINAAVKAVKAGAADYLVREQMTSDKLCLSLRTAVENAGLKRQLQQREEQFQVSVENMLDCFGIFTAMRDNSGQILDFRIDYLNAAACENNQMTREQQVGRGLCEVFPDNRESGLFAEYCQLVETGEPLLKESLIYEHCREGQRLVRAYDIRANRLNDGFVASWRDVTQAKQTEAALRHHRQYYETLAELMPQMVWEADITGAVNYWNQRWYDYTGLSGETSLGLLAMEAVHPDDRDRTLNLWQQAIAEAKSFEIEHRIRNQAGTYRWFINRGAPNRDRQGQLTGWIGTITDIDEQKRLEEHLKLVLQAVDSLVYDWNLPTNEVHQSEKLYDLLGFHLDEVPNDATWWNQRIHPDDQKRIRPQFAAALASDEKLFEVHYRILHRDGHWVDVWDRSRFVRDRAGQVIRIVGSTLDISVLQTALRERQRAEVALRQNQERLNLSMQAAGIGTWDLNLQTGEVHWSDNLQAMFGMVPGSFDGRIDTVMAMIHPDDRQQVQQRLQRAIDAREDYRFEFRFIKPDGTLRWALGMGRVFYDADDNPVSITGIDMDVTERKQAEVALRESEDRLRIAIASAQLGTWDWNLIDNQLTWDAGTKAMFDLPLSAEASIETFFEALHPDDHERVQNSIGKALEPTQNQNFDIEYRIIGGRDQAERWLKATGKAYFDSNGQPLHFIGTVLDITQQKQLEAQRAGLLQQEQAAREAAERANRMKDEFLAILSHELRSPLNPILGWASLLRTKQMSADVTARALETIERNANLQTQLIDDLLDVAKILRGKLKLEMAAVDPVFIIQAAIETVQPVAHAKTISIHTDLSQVAPLYGDAGRLQQVIWNLLTNAVKFTPEDGRVEIRLTQANHWAQIQVSDTGMGIHPDFLPYIFESFRQEDTSVTRKFGGLGLGLAIVRHLVEAHGGAIAADSPGEGQGSTFTVKLPLSPRAPSPAPSDLNAATEADLSDIRVLVIDDNADTLDLLEIALTQFGAEVNACATAPAALAALDNFRPHILICDIGMPEMDGYKLIEKIRSLPSGQGRQVPAIALTAYARDEERQKALNYGFHKHMAKPFDPNQLAVAVADLVNPH